MHIIYHQTGVIGDLSRQLPKSEDLGL